MPVGLGVDWHAWPDVGIHRENHVG